jgi:hypothetical protein
MFERRGISVSSAITPDASLPAVVDHEAHFAGRLLLRYLRKHDLPLVGTDEWRGRQHWVSPTPICTADLKQYLNLPSALPTPTHALLIDPARLPAVRGPRWVMFGFAVEYLIDDIPVEAVVGPKWAVKL